MNITFIDIHNFRKLEDCRIELNKEEGTRGQVYLPTLGKIKHYGDKAELFSSLGPSFSFLTDNHPRASLGVF